MSKKYNVAIVGATGVVGEALLELLAEREFPVEKMYALASERSAGETVLFNQQPVIVQNVADFDFKGVDYAFFSAGALVSKEYAPKAAKAGAMVIDNTSEFRYQEDIPLVIPEVNPEALLEADNRNIVSNPNCSTIQMLVALKPIYDVAGIRRINVTTYQAVSGAGRSAVNELAGQTAALLSGQQPKIEVFDQQIAFNVIPRIDAMEDNGYTREEMKMVLETQKIFNDPNILVNPTAVRVPVFYGHSEAIHLETANPISAAEVVELLSQVPGVCVIEDHTAYPTAISDAANCDDVYVGRIRKDISHPNGINMWVVSDNIRKGAALNAIQIAELLNLKNEHLTLH
jgi:aspartate-semialdehyde dehydrogenase